MSTLSAKEQPLLTVFTEQFFTVPHYQRPYAWGLEQAGQLLSDLRDAADAAAPGAPASSPYFLGSVVVVGAPGIAPEYQVVDGQQRLTTLTLLLAELGRAIVDGALVRQLQGLVAAAANPLAGTPARSRVLLRKQERPFYDAHVVAGEPLASHQDPTQLPDAQRHLWENLSLFRDALREMTQPRLESLALYLAQGCFLVLVRTGDYESAYRIFSVLNTRGLDLEPTDILKANLLGQLPDGAQSEAAKRWEAAEEQVGRAAFVELMSHARTLRLHEKQKGTLTEEVMKLVVPSFGSPAAFIDDLLGRQLQAFDLLSDASYSSATGAERVNRYIRFLNLLPNRDWMPTAMLLFLRFGASASSFGDALQKLERLAVSLSVRKKFFNERVERYKEVLRSLAGGAAPAESPLMLTPTEITSTRAALDGNVYEELAHIRMPLLRRISAMMTENLELEQASQFSVEHVLPQNPAPGSEWLAWYPDERARRAWTHRLGNLVLLSRRRNASASNRPFGEKRATYFQSTHGHTTFGLTIGVLGLTEFTQTVLEKRQREITAMLYREWMLDG